VAAGGDGNPADANPADAFNAIADEMLGVEPEQEEEPEEEEAEGDEPEVELEEAEDEEDIEPEDDLPAIEPPNSLTAEEKEQFKSLPREAQEFTARRIGELEKGFQSKAQEAAQVKQAAQLEALRAVEQIKAQAADALQNYAKQFEMQIVEPDIALAMSDNPADRALYVQQDRMNKQILAQREQAQRDAETARAEQAQIQAARAEHEATMFRQQLEAELPEIFDQASGQELVKELNATAELLGFDPNEISDVSAIKALKVTSEWKTKAEKYDALMRKKMERVRAGKSPPPIAKPGTAREPTQTRRVKADQAWQSALTAKTRNARENALATWAEQTGWLD
jgi:hypothetical protein